jgi:hypothetical protein
MQKAFAFDTLPTADLLIDARYEGGVRGNVADDPLVSLVGGGNQGGFRYVGQRHRNTLRFCILYSELVDPDWPDELNH